jgi:hypothetical protein
MTIPCHLFLSWHLARRVTPDLKARRWIAWSGLLPDLDGVGWLVDAATKQTHLYEDWHHLLGHNFLFALLVAGFAGLASRKAAVAGWTWLSLHVHLVADLVSGRGPDGSQWPVIYGWPLSAYEWEWSGQWPLAAWPNTALFLVLLAWAVVDTNRTGRSPVELVSSRLDQRVLAAFRSVLGARTRTAA